MLLKTMGENNINSFPDDKEELIFTTLCCDDLSMDQLREFVIKHGENIPPTRAAFKAIWDKIRSGGKS